MAMLYNCDKGVILKYAKEIGYVNMHQGILTDADKKEIVSLYNYNTSTELAEKYGVSRGQITKIWHDNNLIGKDKNKYPFDFNYFENIDTPDKAYFLGFLAADGNVFTKNEQECQSIIRLCINDKDENILNVFKTYIDSQKPLHITERKTKEHISYMVELELVSNKMASDLRKYNIIERKTYDYEMTLLKPELMHHYFRGYFDGDGSISCSNGQYHTPSKYNISITGFLHNLSKMQKYLESVGISSIIIADKRNTNLPFGNLVFSKIEEKINFINYIYKDKRDIYLARKHYLAECFINAIKQNYSNKANLYYNFNAVLNETSK